MKRNVKRAAIAALLLLVTCLIGCGSRTIEQERQWEPSKIRKLTQVQELMQNQELMETWHRFIWQDQSQASRAGRGDSVARKEVLEGPVRKPGFQTPEDAVFHYLSGLRDSDLRYMEEAFLYRMDVEKVVCQYNIFCGMDLLGDNGVVNEEVHRLAKEIIRRMEDSDFDNLEFVGFIPLEEMIAPDSAHKENYENYREIFEKHNQGMKLDSRIAAIRVNGYPYLLFFDLAEKEGRWYLYKLGGALEERLGFNMDMTGVVRLDDDMEKAVEQLLAEEGEALPEPTRKDSAAEEKTEGFDSPRQAAASYLEGLKAHDMNQILNTFYLGKYIEKYDFETYCQALSRTFTWRNLKLPPVNEFAKDVMYYGEGERLEWEIMAQAAVFYLFDEYLKDPETIVDGESFSWEEIPEKMELNSFKVLGFVPENAFVNDSAGNTGRIDLMFAPYNADKIDSCAVACEYKGKTYILFMECVEYDGKWYNSGFGNWVARKLAVPAEFKGTVPLEMFSDWEELEEMFEPVNAL